MEQGMTNVEEKRQHPSFPFSVLLSCKSPGPTITPQSIIRSHFFHKPSASTTHRPANPG